MGFNVTGKEVATGAQDPMVMFYIVAAILGLALIIGAGLYIYNMLNK